MLRVPGAVASPMVQKLAALGFGPCRRAVPSWEGRVVLVASVSGCPGCAGVIVGRHAAIKGGTDKVSRMR